MFGWSHSMVKTRKLHNRLPNIYSALQTSKYPLCIRLPNIHSALQTSKYPRFLHLSFTCQAYRTNGISGAWNVLSIASYIYEFKTSWVVIWQYWKALAPYKVALPPSFSERQTKPVIFIQSKDQAKLSTFFSHVCSSLSLTITFIWSIAVYLEAKLNFKVKTSKKCKVLLIRYTRIYNYI